MRVSLAGLRRIAGRLLQKVGCPKDSLSVLLLTDRRIRSLNRLYLRHDDATDVLAFEGGAGFLGDIAISLDTAKRQAARYGNSFAYELAFYLCHGILHLRGYRDGTKKEADKMLQKQARLLQSIGVRNSKWRSRKPKPSF